MLGVITLLSPLITAAIIALGLRRVPEAASKLSVLSAIVGFVCSLIMLIWSCNPVEPLVWATAGDFSLKIGLLSDDKLAQGMLFIVTFVGLLVHVFSLGYMKDDPGKARYYMGLSLFMFSMTGIVLADNFAMMFIFWELVGVSSYLLIGHWFMKDSAADAANKAFMVNRIGDFGFMAGILLLFAITGSLGFEEIRTAIENSPPAQGLLIVATLCIFCGAVGKSAQFPLHVWLPDAMEGPTPVSALIHAATMVAAGVYMMVRVIFLVEAAPMAGEIIAYIGGGTALLAALMATQQDDIKKVLAYSTLSQLGYMVMAVGLVAKHPGGDYAGHAAFFHLYTHAFFKALLFLGSGAIIYACHHEQNIWKMGGLFRRMPKVAITFAIGTAALMGFPFVTSGFWSKEIILAEAYGTPVLFWIGVGTASLTAFYMTRLFLIVFFGEPRTDHAAHAKDPGAVMTRPLMILAVPSLIAASGLVYKWFGIHPPHHADGHATFILGASIGALIFGVSLGFFLYKGKKKEPIGFALFRDKFYIDEIYIGMVRVCQDGVAYVAKALDQIVVDSLAVLGSARLARGVGNLFRFTQVGNLQGYAFLFGGGVLVAIILLFSFAR
ncbi:MAG: NADH-quinone oxidoreductase subunit L [Verrucomicrobiota bacterium]